MYQQYWLSNGQARACWDEGMSSMLIEHKGMNCPKHVIAGSGQANPSDELWHQLDRREVAARLDSDLRNGLPWAEATRRLALEGRNELGDDTRGAAWKILKDQLASTMILVLFAAAVASLLLGDIKDAVAIIAIIVLNATFGFVQDYRAGKAIAGLKKLSAPKALVRRDGELREISAREIVCGDIVLVEAGNIVPADCRILECSNLRADESPLTGESEPTEKSVEVQAPSKTEVNQRNMIYMGSVIVYGRGSAMVINTGMRTELGRIAGMLRNVSSSLTPLQRRLDRLGRAMAAVAVLLVIIAFAFGLYRGEEPKLLFLTSVSMAVAVVPEGLPAVVTVALALGSQRMLRRNALVRRLSAVETLGSVTVICSDKTGTLTGNHMKVTAIEVGGGRVDPNHDDNRDLYPLMLAATLCNDARLRRSSGEEAFYGDPTETALLEEAARRGFLKHELEQTYSREQELPFDSERKRMTTLHRFTEKGAPIPYPPGLYLHPPRLISFTKGAVESVLSCCSTWLAEGNVKKLEPEMRAAITASSERLASSGSRVLGFAYRFQLTTPSDMESELVFAGLVGLSDPPRNEVREAVSVCRSAGVRPIMITGDHPLTARHIANELGIEGGIITGADLDNSFSQELGNVVGDAAIYARVSPEHKLRIVDALQKQGHIVAMTGDGINDAPALKKADIGIAMGITGTDVAKQASDIVLVDDNFATIVAAVEDGRAIYDNIRKFIRYVLAGNLGEIVVMTCGPFLGLPLPLLPLQILWINLVSDGACGLALSSQPPEPRTMQRPPLPPGTGVFAYGVGFHIIWLGLLIGLIPLALGYTFWRLNAPHWQTIVFVTLGLAQIFQTWGAKSWVEPCFAFGFWRDKILLYSTFITVFFTIAIVYLPSLQWFFGTKPLVFSELLLCVAAALVPVTCIEVAKTLKSNQSPILPKNKNWGSNDNS